MTKGKNITLKDCDEERARLLYTEIGKVRAWLSGFKAAREKGDLNAEPPGVDALRQMQIILKDSMRS